MESYHTKISIIICALIVNILASGQNNLPLKGYFADGILESEAKFGEQGDIDSLDIELDSIIYFVLGSHDLGYSEMPYKLDSLENLYALHCVHNFFETVPCGLNIFSKLKFVSYSWNPIKEIPPCIIEYSSLKHLYLNQTEIDSIPEEICQLKKLEIISLGNSGVRYIPDCMANMPNLKVIDLKCDWLPEDVNIELLESDREILRFTVEDRKRLREMMPHVRIVFGEEFD